MKRLICCGDSITAGEISDDGTERLTPRLRRGLTGWEVINAGVPGNNTRDALLRIEKDVLGRSPDLVTVLFGANYAAAHKMVGLDEYRSNISCIAKKITPQKTILITPSPVDERRPRNRTNDILKEYSDAAAGVALSSGCQVIDLFSEMLKRPDYTDMLSDGLHFTGSGYEFLYRLILKKINDDYREEQ